MIKIPIMVHGYHFWYIPIMVKYQLWYMDTSFGIWIPVLVYTTFGIIPIMVYTRNGILPYNLK